jgi:uncharacterized membrane protein YcaP (DUF421 family)
MWVFDHTLLQIVFRTAIIYIMVLIGIRLVGKREVGQMTPFDLVLLLLIANAVQNAMTGPDTSLTGGLVAGGTLLLMNSFNAAIEWRSKRFRALVEGQPALLISKGKVIEKNLQREQVTSEELLQALREHGVAGISAVGMAVLEVDGSISVLKKDELPVVPKPHHSIHLPRRK